MDWSARGECVGGWHATTNVGSVGDAVCNIMRQEQCFRMSRCRATNKRTGATRTHAQHRGGCAPCGFRAASLLTVARPRWWGRRPSARGSGTVLASAPVSPSGASG
eukprot:223888-Chlamydomonas_euryale.AAC.1